MHIQWLAKRRLTVGTDHHRATFSASRHPAQPVDRHDEFGCPTSQRRSITFQMATELLRRGNVFCLGHGHPPPGSEIDLEKDGWSRSDRRDYADVAGLSCRPDELYPADAVARLHHYAGGVPRALNNAAVAALIAAAADGKKLVDDTCARKAVTELTKDQQPGGLQ